eukprot:TRINITY_DN11519_c0_g3_i4.p2 TRINITY_DN11519_c0_g3~~TRINITY_DN11519_c0_g3_i4.p2  ORF type:complete len:261 (+),score=63.47 TRINITY_DN11519_c0_g3_i4:2090-2872(+)
MAGEQIDYYELLGIERTASSAEIKKAYRKAALIHHPDKNPGQEEQAASMFKLVSEAYDVLSDPDKRNVYDRYGHEGLKQGAGGPSAASDFHFRNPADLFREVFGDSAFGGGDPFASFFGGSAFGGFGGGFDDPFASRSRGQQPFGMSPFGGSLFGGDPFGGFGNDPFGGFGNGQGGGSMFQSFSSGGLGGGSFSQSSSTTIRNGKKVTTTKTVENGMSSERTEVRDARTGDLLDLHINGVQQDVGQLEYGRQSSRQALRS